jgi:hypothetical protein
MTELQRVRLAGVIWVAILLAGIGILPAVAGDEGTRPLTVIALGDVGETGSVLRANSTYAVDMYMGRHDGGTYDAMIFLGNNFLNIGLNGPKNDADSKASYLMGKFREAIRGLGRTNVHAIPGNHDYYRKNMVEQSFLFGLFTIEERAMGLSDVGNKRAAALEEWSYHFGMPAEATYPLKPGSNERVQFIFFDTALPLRSDPSRWTPALDSLHHMLTRSAQQPGIVWRVFVAHHPFASLGEHGGYAEWNDEAQQVEYLTHCDKDSNANAWFQNWLDPEDLCAQRYRQLMDSLASVIAASGAQVQIALGAHDNSLQIIRMHERTDASGIPPLQIISGAGSRVGKVKASSPPDAFTSANPNPKQEGEAIPGFVQLQFDSKAVRVRFFNARTGEWMLLKGNEIDFFFGRDGTLRSSANGG